ncbi:MAG: hypothetical protein NTU49_07450 [Gammaproteobacteria bacterium]|nr:hypothetical protein [Gammaproteobacteria bacterium]
MSRNTVYQSLQPNGLTNENGSASLLPVFSSQTSFPERTKIYMDERGTIDPIDISGIQWMLATLAIRARLNNNPQLKQIKDKKTGEMIDNLDQKTPAIGLLCREMLELIIHFGLGVSANVTGFYKNTQGKLVSVSRQDHLMKRTFFTMRPKRISSEDGSEIFLEHILHDLITAVKNDDRKQVEYILLKNPRYLTLTNSDGVTALAMALRTDNPIIVKMMETYFFDETKMPDGKAIMLHQFNTVFPEGYEAHCAQQKADAKKLFMDAGIIDAKGECILFNGVSEQDVSTVFSCIWRSLQMGCNLMRPEMEHNLRFCRKFLNCAIKSQTDFSWAQLCC